MFVRGMFFASMVHNTARFAGREEPDGQAGTHESHEAAVRRLHLGGWGQYRGPDARAHPEDEERARPGAQHAPDVHQHAGGQD